MVTCQPGRGIVRQLETGLKDADLVSLRRLLVVQMCGAGDWGQDTPSPEASQTEGSEDKNAHTERPTIRAHADIHIHTFLM